MKYLILILMLTRATLVSAQVEIIPREDSQKAAIQLNNALGTDGDVPFHLETDILNAFAIKGGEAAMLAVPVHSLEQKIESAKHGETIPAGQLWLHKIVPEIDGKPASRKQLRMVSLDTDNGSDEVALFHLVIKKTKPTPELLVFGTGRNPLESIPLRKMNVPQEAPIELDGRKRDDQSGELSIYLGDRYEARMIVRPASPSE